MVRAEDGPVVEMQDTEICRLMASIKEAEREPTGKDRRFEENNRRSIETEREGTRGTRFGLPGSAVSRRRVVFR